MRFGKVLFAGLVAYGIVKLTEHIAEKAAKTVIEEEKRKDNLDEEVVEVPTVGEVVRRIISRHVREAVVGIVDDILGTGRKESSANHNRFTKYYGMICKHCGHKLRIEDRWCPNCGEKVTEGRYHYG